MNPYLLTNIKQVYQYKPIINDRDIFNLLLISTKTLRITCALEATKIVLPIWEKYEPYKLLTKEQKEAPRKAVELMEKWLEGKATTEEMGKSADVIFYINKQDNPIAVNDTLSSVTYAVDSVTNIFKNNVISVYDSVTKAARAYAHAKVPVASIDDSQLYQMLHFSEINEFYKKWRASCSHSIQKELNEKYDLLCKKISGEL